MDAALAEFKAEELGQDVEEDNDFVVVLGTFTIVCVIFQCHLRCTDEQDAFESDFESTDEEGAQEDVDASAEKMIKEEERKIRKAGCSLSK